MANTNTTPTVTFTPVSQVPAKVLEAFPTQFAHANDFTLRVEKMGKRGLRFNIVGVNLKNGTAQLKGNGGENHVAPLTSLVFAPVSDAWAQNAARRSGSSSADADAAGERMMRALLGEG